MWSHISKMDIRNGVKQMVGKQLITTSKVFTQDVTHLIVPVDENGQIQSYTAKYLLAVAAGIWVIQWKWVVDCLKMNAIVSEVIIYLEQLNKVYYYCLNFRSLMRF